MTQEEKQLLLQDMCARLPYGVKLLHTPTNEITNLEMIGNGVIDGNIHDLIENFKPCLFPLSSMTAIQENEFHFLFSSLVVDRDDYGLVDIISKSIKDKWDDTYNYQTYLNDWKKAIQWLLKNHFDINKLIPKNLAINAIGLNIY